jgi:hypothetical protein
LHTLEAMMDERATPGKRWAGWTVTALLGAVAIAALLMRYYAWLLPGAFAPPGHVLRQLPERMSRLQPGMTESQVWWELALTPYRVHDHVGNGPSNNYQSYYFVGSGHCLLLRFNNEITPPRFTGGSLSVPGGKLVSSPDLVNNRRSVLK